jgi:pimeloyl-ACP methyl ester carboxylesterase
MSSLVTDQGIVHYETFGSGPPVILLHGWIGSWGLWQPTMEALGHTHRCYALDFWGFGESGKKRASYAVSDFMELVRQFMDALGIAQAPLVGHSMGGTTSLGTTLRYPERITKVCVIGSPIVGTSLSIFLQLAGIRWIGSVARILLPILKGSLRVTRPIITRDPKWYQMVARDLSRTTVDSFFSSIGSLRRTDLRPRLPEIQAPVMGIYGRRDVIVHPRQYQPLRAGVPHARIEVMPGSGHFPMLDEPDKYLSLIRSFLETTPSPRPLGSALAPAAAPPPDAAADTPAPREAGAAP